MASVYWCGGGAPRVLWPLSRDDDDWRCVAGNMGNDNYHSQATTAATPTVATLVLEVKSVILLYLALNPSPKMRMGKSTAISMGGGCVSTKLVGNIGT